MNKLVLVSAVAGTLLAAAGSAAAAQLVVVEATGVKLAAGQAIDGAKPLALGDGAEVTLVAASGQIIKLHGPGSVVPDSRIAGAGSTDVSAAMAALVTERNARTSEVGVVRGGGEVKLPDPWVVDVSHPGTSCVQAGKPVVLWRDSDLAEAPVRFSPKDRSWTVSGKWQRSADRIAFPAGMPLRDKFDYVIEIGDRVAPVTVRVIPTVVNNDAMRAAYMDQIGCGKQVNALIALMKH